MGEEHDEIHKLAQKVISEKEAFVMTGNCVESVLRRELKLSLSSGCYISFG